MKIPFTKIEIIRNKVVPASKEKVVVNVPRGQVSQADFPNLFQDFINGSKQLTPDACVNYIETVRKNYPFIQNLSLAITDLVQLANTGHEVFFDNSTKSELVKEMRDVLVEDAKGWLDGGASADSITNKTLSQLYIGGAIANEWVPKNDLSAIDHLTLVNPENIRFYLNPRTNRFDPYQQLKYQAIGEKFNPNNVIKLNTNTFKYFGMGGDTASPYGIPPFVAALSDLAIQKDMLKNIQFIVQQLGILGFIELVLEKPAQNRNESESAYGARLTQLLTDAKTNLVSGTKDGVLVGYEGDHSYEFHSTSQNISGLAEIFNLNQTLLANGLKYSNSFMGGGGDTETNITVIFTKMLSQLKTVQNLVGSNLEFGYALHLRLKGYTFKNLTVSFKPSTITDDLKIQQAEEIKIRNKRVLYADGIINLVQYANELGYEEPDQAEPRATIDPDGTIAKEKQAEQREKDKDKSDRKGREKKKTQPKRKDSQSKPV